MNKVSEKSKEDKYEQQSRYSLMRKSPFCRRPLSLLYGEVRRREQYNFEFRR